MTITTITLLGRTGTPPIELIPVYDQIGIVLFDGYIDGTWIGSRRLIRHFKNIEGYKNACVLSR